MKGAATMTRLRSFFAALCLAASALLAASPAAQAQSEASAALSLLPMACVVGSASAAGEVLAAIGQALLHDERLL